MNWSRRNVVAGIGAAASTAVMGLGTRTARAADTPVRLMLPWLPLGTFSSMFVAKKMGFWEKQGLDVTIDRGFGSTKVCIPVDQGQYDFGLLDMAVLAGCVGRGLDLKAIGGLWPRSPIGIFSSKELNITKPKDLEGKEIGFVVGGGEFQLWPAFVKATKIDAKKIKIISLDQAALMTAVADKSIKVVGNYLGSIAPTMWANDMQINGIFYEDYGVRMFSVCFAAKRVTIEKKPDLCRKFMAGAMEGLKYAYLNPEKAIDIHIESLKEFQDGNPRTRKTLMYGQEVATSLGLVPSFKAKGLGYMDPDLVEETRASVQTYMDIQSIPPAKELYTNDFVGSLNLTDVEWATVQSRVKKELPI